MAGHYHLHDDDGTCYGDYRDFEDAARAVAEIMDTWRTTWGAVPLTVIDAPFCIQDCND